MSHNHIGHSYTDHNCIGHNYVASAGHVQVSVNVVAAVYNITVGRRRRDTHSYIVMACIATYHWSVDIRCVPAGMDRCTDMCMDMWECAMGVRADTCADMCTAMCADMCVWTCA